MLSPQVISQKFVVNRVLWITAYVIVDVIGDTCDPIATKTECEEAYAQLGIILAVDDNQSGSSDDPPYCYMKWGRLKFNTDGSNTGACDANGRECVCIEGNENMSHN